MQALKDLYLIAREELKNIYGEDAFDFRFEQYEYYEKEERTEIVISYLIKKDAKSLLDNSASTFFIVPFERVYKQVILNPEKQVERIIIFDN